MAEILLISGRPGVGKTTLIRRLAEALGEQAGGFYTEEIRGPEGRLGFRLITLEGKEATFAHVDLARRVPYRVGRYGVDVSVLDHIGVEAILRAVHENQVILVDEIGKMELYSTRFRQVLEDIARGWKPLVATITKAHHPWAEAFKRQPTATLWEITVTNRDLLLEKVIDWLRQREVVPKGHPFPP
ncbi:MAG: NTPase [Armatimonadota bacterium]|nr:NTPase [Armatimonadota bacterium]MDR5704055.1 NTPase [Armatimonadota bacterium]MDR7435427.1 NTPase [Armatimonadota bacterium]